MKYKFKSVQNFCLPSKDNVAAWALVSHILKAFIQCPCENFICQNITADYSNIGSCQLMYKKLELCGDLEAVHAEGNAHAAPES